MEDIDFDGRSDLILRAMENEYFGVNYFWLNKEREASVNSFSSEELAKFLSKEEFEQALKAKSVIFSRGYRGYLPDYEYDAEKGV
jgi:hypothetical protein